MYKRGSGILMHLTSLPSNHGIGDMGSNAYNFADLLSKAGQKYWQVLPLNPGNPQNGESPYFSSSAFAGNPLLVNLEMLVKERLLDEDDAKPFIQPDQTCIDFDLVRPYKLAILNKAYRKWKTIKPSDPNFQDFCRAQAHWLDGYALFMIAGVKQGTYQWTQWPEPLRDRHESALKELLQNSFEEIERQKFFQYLFFTQWHALKQYCSNLGISIVGDIPIYVSHESADVWENRELFKLDEMGNPVMVSGVPPDYFSATGQLWNNPVYNWEKLQRTGYKWWLNRMSAMFERFDIVRIDHFRGLVQYWEIPAGEPTAINGKWMDVPVHDFLNTLTAHFKPFPVIAEDLGLITPDVYEIMDQYGFPGMKILQFAFSEDNPQNPYLPHNYPRNSLVYTGTHDNNATQAWLNNELDEAGYGRIYRYLGFTPPKEEVLKHLIRLAQSSVADIAVIPLQDYLGLSEKARMNDPSTIEGNWRWRATAEQIKSVDAGALKELSETYNR
ncbi:4-alpha-glucanotransferase (amylomaltase) [Chitinispirillum alkaliphilum]|nr:4-alpha-glucanotransferase (amylomaltase) [Chitinispirillum alkaliphilum]